MRYGKPEIKTVSIDDVLAGLGPARALLYGQKADCVKGEKCPETKG
jgi:hypothetical protein